MLNISRINDNQIAKFRQLIEHNKRNIILQKSCRKWGRETSSRLCFVFQKKLYIRSNQVVHSLISLYFIALKLVYNKNKLFKILHYWSRDIFHFDFLDKGLEIVCSPHFVYDFPTKVLLMLYSISWPNFIVWLFLLLEILAKMCIATVF